MDEDVVPRALFKWAGHRRIGTRRELAASQETSGGTPEYASVLLGRLHCRWRLALVPHFCERTSRKSSPAAKVAAASRLVLAPDKLERCSATSSGHNVDRVGV